MLSSFYLFVTFYVAFKFHAYLPTADLIARASFLFDAYKDGFSLDIFGLHNVFHWIVFPKAVLSLDMMLTQGSGWIIKGVSIACLIGSIGILLAAIYKTPYISPYQKHLLAILMTGLIAGPWVRESLNSPISQYTMISFFLLLSAYLFSFSNSGRSSKLGISAAILLLLMSSGQAIAFFPALIAAYWKKHIKKFTIIFFGIVVVYALIEILLVVVFKQRPLLFLAYSVSYDEENLAIILTYFWKDPAAVLALFGSSVTYFLAKFSFPQIYNALPELPLKVLAVIFYGFIIAIFIRYESRWRGERFWIICAIFCLLTAFLPTFLRLADGYGNRFANLGSLLLASFSMLLVLHKQGKYTNIIISLLALYLLICLPNTYKNIEKDNHGLLGASMIKPQVAYSIGLRDPDLIVSAPGAWWREPDSQGIYAFSPVWKENQLGVYGSDNYLTFAGKKTIISKSSAM